MPFATDRDLLILEPNLFREIAWTAQRLVGATCTVAGTTLTASGVEFDAQGVTAGHVALVDGVPVEVVARLSPTQLTVSRPRPTLDDGAIPPSPCIGKPLVISTFLPQLQIVHDQVLRLVGIDPAEAGVDGALTEASIKNPRSLRLVEALGALHLILAGAAAIGGAGFDGGLADRAEMYRFRFDRARRVAGARVDTDGDGVAEVTRHLNLVQLSRQ